MEFNANCNYCCAVCFVGLEYGCINVCNVYFSPLVMAAKFPKSDITRKSTILLEGRRLVSEGLAASLQVTSLFFTDVHLLAGLPLEYLTETGTRLYRVSAKHMKIWSDTVAPSGLMG